LGGGGGAQGNRGGGKKVKTHYRKWQTGGNKEKKQKGGNGSMANGKLGWEGVVKKKGGKVIELRDVRGGIEKKGSHRKRGETGVRGKEKK